MRPKIICHMMGSIDGRLLVDRWTPPAAGIDADKVREHYDGVAGRIESDGWIVGRKTMESFAERVAPATRRRGTSSREIHVAERKGRNVAVAIDPTGKLHYGGDDAGGDHIVAVLSEKVSDDYLAELRRDGVSYLFAGPAGHDLSRAMDVLGDAFGVRTILLEGGGRINGAFLKARLIDELSILIYPGIDGLAGVSSIFEFAGGRDDKPAAGRSLRHFATETLYGGVVWLRYRFEDEPK